MSIKERLSGNEAVANAMRQINPDVMPAYPITPSTEIPQYFKLPEQEQSQQLLLVVLLLCGRFSLLPLPTDFRSVLLL